jgi:hypothetical protein
LLLFYRLATYPYDCDLARGEIIAKITKAAMLFGVNKGSIALTARRSGTSRVEIDHK